MVKFAFFAFSIISLVLAAENGKLQSKPRGEKRAIQQDSSIMSVNPKARALVARNAVALRDLKAMDAKRYDEFMRRFRERVAAERKAKKTSVPSNGGKVLKDTLLKSLNTHPDVVRSKRDIASTVVGAAVSSVVANLMKTASQPAEHNQKQADEPRGAILSSGEVPVANEIVPLPFAPVVQLQKDVPPVANEVVPAAVAPIHADVEVVVGGNATSTSTTSAPSSSEKKGFWATLFNSIKLFFGTVTNSVGGFFIDVGQRVTSFVEGRIKV